MWINIGHEFAPISCRNYGFYICWLKWKTPSQMDAARRKPQRCKSANNSLFKPFFVALGVFWNLVLKSIKLWKLLNLERFTPDLLLNYCILSHIKFGSWGLMSSFYCFLVLSIALHPFAGTQNQTPPGFTLVDKYLRLALTVTLLVVGQSVTQ